MTRAASKAQLGRMHSLENKQDTGPSSWISRSKNGGKMQQTFNAQ